MTKLLRKSVLLTGLIVVAGPPQSIAQDVGRSTVALESSMPTASEIEAALFQSDLLKVRAECQKARAAGIKCQAIERKPAVGLTQITFKRGSAALSDEGREVARRLGEVLQKRKSDAKTIIVEGHTDATGPVALNEKLSKERAVTVQKFLEKEFDLASVTIEPVGMGSRALKDKKRPEADINRRIEVVLDK